MIGRLVLFRATGDLAGRFLLSALAGLQGAGELPLGYLLGKVHRVPYEISKPQLLTMSPPVLDGEYAPQRRVWSRLFGE